MYCDFFFLVAKHFLVYIRALKLLMEVTISQNLLPHQYSMTV